MEITKTTLPAAPAPLDQRHAALKDATQKFESFFVHQLLSEMRKTIPKDTLLGDQDNQQAIFQDMMDQNLADTVSKRGDFGLAQMMYDQLSKSLDGQSAPAVKPSAANAPAADAQATDPKAGEPDGR